MIRVLFVCLGNICRSPSAEGIFRALVEHQGLADVIHTDSAGTGAWHEGEPPDRRAQAAARQRGIDLSYLRARPTKATDFTHFDYILAMDRDNLTALNNNSPAAQRHKLHLMMDFAPDHPQRQVPDPYYGGPQGFDDVLDMLEQAAEGLLARICAEHQLDQ